MPIAPVPATTATLAEKWCEPAAVEHVIGGERLDLAGRAIDADARAHLDRVALDAALKLLVAVMRQPHRLAGKADRGERDIKDERRVVASAEAAADMGELRVDVRRACRARGPCPSRCAIDSAAS